ncbi:MAG: AAA family ATPase [Chloroflexi bacterium OHK40]
MDANPHAAARHWEIQALGALQVSHGHGLRSLGRAGCKRLLAFLLLHRRAPVARERLIDALWPDCSLAEGRRRLADALYLLRRALPPAAIEAHGELLALSRELRVDVWAFEQLAASDDPANWRAAIELYGGELLPEIYDEWAVGLRAAAHDRYIDCLARLAEREPDAAQAIALYRRLVAADALRESAHMGLMRALAEAGREAEALDVYEQLERVLAENLGLAPGSAARAMAASLRERLAGARRIEASRTRRLARPAFVGRAAERAELLGRLDAARAGHGGLALVLGEAGIGKSRLVEEVAALASWRGWKVFGGRGEELTIARPFAPLSQAIAAALPRPRRQQLSHAVPAEALAIVERMVWPGQPAPSPASSDDRADYPQLAAALSVVLAGLARFGPPLIILDDVQWAAPDLWPLLDALRLQLAEHPAFVLLLGRAQELRALPAASASLERWTAQGAGLITLAGLTHAELAELAHSCGAGDLGPTELAHLAADSGGNPLLALALLRAGPPGHTGPRSLEALVTQRLAGLSPPARRALDAAAVIGATVAYPLWEAALLAAGLPADELPALVAEIEFDSMLSLEERGYRFAHEMLRTAIYGGLGPEQRQGWHRQIFDLLSRMDPDDHSGLLHHAEGAGNRDAIARHALALGVQSLAAASYAAGRRAFERALEVLAPSALVERYEATAGLVACIEVLADRSAQRAAAEALAALAEHLGDDQHRAEAAWRRAGLEWAVGQFAAAEQTALAGLAAAERHGDRRLQARLDEIVGRCARDLGDYGRAEQRFVAARDVYVALGDTCGAAWIDGMLGLVALRQGRLREAVAYQRRAAEAFHSAGDPYHELRALSGLAIALWWAGDYLSARAIFERILELSERLGDGRMQEAGLHNLGALADLLGDYETAVVLKSRALARSRAAENPMGVAVGLCNLGITFFKLGRYDEALGALDEALVLDRATGRRTGEAFCLHSQGQTLAAAGRAEEARAAFEAARTIRHALGERDVLLSTEAELALLDLAAGKADAARAAVDELLGRLNPDDRADLREQIFYVASCALVACGETAAATVQLRRAATAMHEALAPLPPEARARLLERDPLHHTVALALSASASIATARLVRADVPLGRKLTEADYIEICWTVDAPDDERFARPDERRRHALRRLLREAAAQGAAPTDTDLASALGVSRRTILRDMAALAAEGTPAPTRRRVSQ